jgi:D-glycero-D-manno-heptose 1,7-bisphosphate phosphatase
VVLFVGPNMGWTPSGARGLFLDRDGVVIENRANYVRSHSDIALIPGSAEAVRKAHDAGYTVVIVSNQAAVGRGLLSADEAVRLHEHVLALLRHHGAPVGASYLCPHDPLAGCHCRKPEPGLLMTAMTDLEINAGSSLMVGDAMTDLVAGDRADVPSVMVRTGRGRDQAVTVEAAVLGVRQRLFDDLASVVDRLVGKPRGASRSSLGTKTGRP